MDGVPVTVAVVNDYEIVVQGLAAVLSRYPDRIVVRDRLLVGEPLHHGPVDVALYDTYGRVAIAGPALRALTRQPGIGQVAVFSLDFPAALVADARALGVRSFISKTLPGTELADALVDTARGHDILAIGGHRRAADPVRQWPGRHAGLSERESQVLVLCAEGLSNRQIAEALYVSVDTVKSHLRRAYRRLGIHNRAQAATYVHTSGAFVRVRPDLIR